MKMEEIEDLDHRGKIYFRQKKLQRTKAGKRGGRHRAFMFRKSKNISPAEAKKLCKRAVKYKAEKVGLGQTSDHLVKFPIYSTKI